MKQTVLRLYEQAQLETKKSNLVQESYVCILLGEGIRRHSQNMKILEGFDGSVWQIPEILQDMKQHLQDITLKELASRWNRREDTLRHELKMETGYLFRSFLVIFAFRRRQICCVGQIKVWKRLWRKSAVAILLHFTGILRDDMV